MNGVHNLGGTDGLGPVVAPDASLDERTRTTLATPRDTGHHEAHREPVAVDPARSAV